MFSMIDEVFFYVIRQEVSRCAESWVGQSEEIPREAMISNYPININRLYLEARDRFFYGASIAAAGRGFLE